MNARRIFYAVDAIAGLVGTIVVLTSPQERYGQSSPQKWIGLVLVIVAVVAPFLRWEAAQRAKVATRDFEQDLRVLGLYALQGSPLAPSVTIPLVDQPRPVKGRPDPRVPVLTDTQRAAYAAADSRDLRRAGVTSFVSRCRHLCDAPDPGTAHRVALYDMPAEYGPLRILVALNGTRHPVTGLHEHVLVRVANRHTDPISAAAASYGADVTASEYLSLARRV